MGQPPGNGDDSDAIWEPDLGPPIDFDAPPEPEPEPEPEARGRCYLHERQNSHTRCAACGKYICAACRTVDEGPEGDGERRLCPPCAPAHAVTPSIPFEQADLGFWQGAWRTYWMIWNRPTEVFRAFPQRPVLRAVAFAWLGLLPLAVVAVGCAGGVSLLLLGTGYREEGMEDLAPMAALLVGLPLAAAIIYPVLAFFHACFAHAVALMAGARYGFGTTLRIYCYMAPLESAILLPYCGRFIFWIIAVMWGYKGMRRVQGLGVTGAVFAALAPVVGMLLLGCGLAVLYVSLAMSGILGPAGPFRPPPPPPRIGPPPGLTGPAQAGPPAPPAPPTPPAPKPAKPAADPDQSGEPGAPPPGE